MHSQSVRLYVLMSVSLSVCPSVCLIICLSVSLSVCPSVCLYVQVSVYLFICFSACLLGIKYTRQVCACLLHDSLRETNSVRVIIFLLQLRRWNILFFMSVKEIRERYRYVCTWGMIEWCVNDCEDFNNGQTTCETYNLRKCLRLAKNMGGIWRQSERRK